MKKTFISLLILPLFFGFFSHAFASAVVGSTEFTQIFNNIELIGVGSADAVTAASSISDKIKNYSLDPIASKIANDLVNRAMGDTLKWMQSGFEGGGPGFIVNPDAYFKNVANQEIRIQLDSLNKTNNPYKSALSVSLIKNIRTGRTNVGAQLNFTLFETVQKETCTGNNLQKIAEMQADTNLSTSNDNNGLSRAEKVTKIKGELYNEFCTSAAKSDPQAQAKLQSCVQSGGCGSWGTLFASYSPNNTYYGQQGKIASIVIPKVDATVAVQKTKISNGVIPQEVCKVRLQVDDTDNPYPEGGGPCVEWNIQSPVEAVVAKLDQAITGAYGKLSNVHSFGDLLGNVAESFITNQVEKALYSGLAKVTSGSTNKGSLNVTYDNLLANNGSALPDDLIKKPVGIDSEITSADITKAIDYCKNQSEAKKSALDQVCKHMSSVQNTNTVDTNYMNYISGYLSTLSSLETCSQSMPGSSYEKLVNDRKESLSTYSNIDEFKARIAIYNKSMLKLASIVNTIVEGDDAAMSNTLVTYASISSDSSNMIPFQQEKVDSQAYAKMKREVDADTPNLKKQKASCEEEKCSANPEPSCPNYYNNRGNVRDSDSMGA